MQQYITGFFPSAKILGNLIGLTNTELISFFTKTDLSSINFQYTFPNCYHLIAIEYMSKFQ